MPSALADMVGTQDGLEATDGHFTANATGFNSRGPTSSRIASTSRTVAL
jgi:hypothetical protein